METIYKKKRIESGMSKSDMANALNIDYKKYKMIEKGQIKLPEEMLNKFNEICNKGASINKLEQLSLQDKANQFWEEVKQKKNDEFVLYEKMKEFNITSYNQLGKLLGYSGGAPLSHYLNEEYVSEEFKKRLFNFFRNELNKQEPTKKKVTKKRHVKPKEYKNKELRKEPPITDKDSEEYVELLKWYKDFNFVDYMEKNNLTIEEISRVADISKTSCRYMVLKETIKPAEFNVKKLYDFISNKKEEKMVNINDVKENYRNKVEKMIQEIEELERQLVEKRKKLEISKEVLEEIEKI